MVDSEIETIFLFHAEGVETEVGAFLAILGFLATEVLEELELMGGGTREFFK